MAPRPDDPPSEAESDDQREEDAPMHVVDELSPPPRAPLVIDESEPGQLVQLKKLCNAQENTCHMYWGILKELRRENQAQDRIIRKQLNHIWKRDRELQLARNKLRNYQRSLEWALNILNKK